MRLLQPSLSVGTAVMLFVLSIGVASASASVVYSGRLDSSSGGLSGTGAWVDTSGKSTTIVWTISQNANGTFHYHYVVTAGAGGAPCDFIIQTSTSFAPSDITNATGAYVLGTWSPGTSLPNLPAAVYGLEFTTGTIDFDSDHAPTWGNAYAVGGTSGGYGQNSVWNAGFLNPPLNNPPQSGVLGNEMLVPDTISVPEPAAMGLLGIGLVGMFAARKPRRK